MDPQPGDFQLVPVGFPVGQLIELGQWLNGDGFIPYEHARIYVGAGNFVQAEPHGAVVASGRVDRGVWSTGRIPLSGIQRAAVVLAAQDYAAKRIPYGWLDYAAIAVHRLHLPAPGLRNFMASHRTMICSQLVDQCYQDAGVHLFSDGRWPGFVTPADLYNLLRHS